MAVNDEFLLKFLEIGVVDVGGDDAKLEKLRTTVVKLSSELKRKPAKTSLYTMVAADPDVPHSDPTIQEAMAELQQQWTTAVNTFSGTPVAIIRAMLLDALVQASRLQDPIAVAFVNSARNVLPYTASIHEQPIWEEAISEIETKVDKRAEAEWATPEMLTIQPLNYIAPEAFSVEPNNATLDYDVLYTKISQATGPWASGDHNPHNPNNQPHPWGKEFARRLSTALVEVLDEALEESRPKPINLSAPLSGLADSVSTHVEHALAAFGGATAGLQRRTNLLWWKEALYSPSAHASYRDMPVFAAAALMAFDLYQQVPAYSPASVSAFLNEAIQLLPQVAHTEDTALLTLVTNARESTQLTPLREAAAKLMPVAVGRGPILSLIGHSNDPAALDSSSLRRLCGVDAEVSLSPQAWGTWLFRELQAVRATNETKTKRTRRKG
ncbi:conserved hypothetical protein [Halomonas sp. A3H3]|uniref:GTPase-associated system helical domain-containing protein n=1 Tax=Vreelandella titanicae TaxID=664683 RepID=A0AAP9NSB2_9GAMM|nr:GTPase-associated system all-helical protein GASH [Halomonas sp. KRD171]QKS27266.1 hypothetical protein FX987_05087 [Halomonas titanicae]CDG51232.1 conserved hypothetical protein [Halomonas sp. A3H3]SDJ02863.1 hypothetical protein SAMN04487867_12122 [Halomonas titanicae]